MALVVWDLDGTLLDTEPGIFRSLELTFAELGRPAPDDMRALIGPPLTEGFAGLGYEGEELRRAVAAYRHHYAEHGAPGAQPFDGVPEALGAVAAAGHRQVVATAKQHGFAVAMVEESGLGRWIDTVVGITDDDVRPGKRDAVRVALGDADPNAAVMVGDREHDVDAARHLAMAAAVGAGWGYARPGELEEAGADVVVATPAEVLAAVEHLVPRRP